MSVYNPRIRRRARAGFTLIELLVVMAIIAVLIGYIMPTGQNGREVANRNRAIQALRQIVSAEKKNGQPTAELADLAKQGLIDPTLGTGSKNGYRFAVTLLPAGGFRATALPAAPGITGAVDLTADEAGTVSSKPSRGADEARKAMFAAIEKEGATAIGRYLAQASLEQLPAAQRALKEAQEPAAIGSAFPLLDADGDGKVTFQEIRAYDEKGGDPLSDFLDSFSRLTQLGRGNEDVRSLPGVSLRDLQSDGK